MTSPSSLTQDPLGNLTNTYNRPIMISNAQRAPTVNDIYPCGTQWQYVSVVPNIIYVTTGGGNWISDSNPLFSSISVSGISYLSGGVNLNPVVVSGASPQTANARSGQVTFTGVSIAAGGSQSFVINNTAISSINTVIQYSLVGAPSGASLTIESVTNVANTSSTILVTNGTGASSTTSNITFTFVILN